MKYLIRFNSIRYFNTRGRNDPVVKYVEPKRQQVGKPEYEPFPYKVTEHNKSEILQKLITPLYDTSYEDQLLSKETYCRNILRELSKELTSHGTPVRLDHKKLPCPVNKIVPSSMIDKYRNFDSFRIWEGIDGRPTVGYLLFPISKHGDSICVDPLDVRSMTDVNKELYKIFRSFIQSNEDMPICKEFGVAGGWRRFIAKCNKLNDVVACAKLNPCNMRTSELTKYKEMFKEFVLSESKNFNLNLNAIFIHQDPHDNSGADKIPYELLYGEKYLTETIFDKKIQIPIGTQLPVNMFSTEKLYKTILEVSNEAFSEGKQTNKPLIIELGSDAGSLGIFLSEYASQVICIDKSTESCEAGKENAALNNITNVDFINAPPEIALGRILSRLPQRERNVVIVCNTRVGWLPTSVIMDIKHARNIEKILYITSRPLGLSLRNIVSLCRREFNKNATPFVPILSAPVDTHPHIEQVTMITALERAPTI